MATIGFRCLPNDFVYVILNGTQKMLVLVAKDKIAFPRGVSRGSHLAWLRKEVIEIIGRYKISESGMKAPEPIAMSKSLQRSEVEGVVKEAVFSTLRKECVSRIKSQLRRDIAGFSKPARYLSNVLTDTGLEALNLPLYDDATLAAIAQLPE